MLFHDMKFRWDGELKPLHAAQLEKVDCTAYHASAWSATKPGVTSTKEGKRLENIAESDDVSGWERELIDSAESECGPGGIGWGT
jgi:hypothetical protein